MMADNIEHVISYWVVFEEFDSPVLGGYAVISHWAPFLLGGVYFGALADRYDGRKLFLIAMAMFMAVSLGWAYVFWTDTLAVWHAIALLTLHGLAGVIYTPASQVMIHDIVGDAQLNSAVRLTATTRALGLMFGPAIGGGLLITVGPAAGIALNAAIYIPMVWWSLRMPYTGHSHEDPEVVRSRPLNLGFGTMFETIREASKSRTIASMLILAGLTSFLVGNAHQAQMPEFAKEFLSDDSGVLYSALLTAGAVGGIFGGLVLELLPSMSPTPKKATAFAVAWSLSIIAFAAAPNYRHRARRPVRLRRAAYRLQLDGPVARPDRGAGRAPRPHHRPLQHVAERAAHRQRRHCRLSRRRHRHSLVVGPQRRRADRRLLAAGALRPAQAG